MKARVVRGISAVLALMALVLGIICFAMQPQVSALLERANLLLGDPNYFWMGGILLGSAAMVAMVGFAVVAFVAHCFTISTKRMAQQAS